MIRRQTWVATLRLLAACDVLLDQDPPFPMSYGGLSVEAACFKVPVVTRVYPECRVWLERFTGMKSPFITWGSDEDLLERVYQLTEHPEIRQDFGNRMYRWCKRIHDERSVVERFFKIVEEMD